MSPVLFYACINPECSVYLFRANGGICNRCGQVGWRLVWTPKKEKDE